MHLHSNVFMENFIENIITYIEHSKLKIMLEAYEIVKIIRHVSTSI